LPGKPLLDLGGQPIIEWVRGAVLRAETVSRVIVAADDQEIIDVVRAKGGEAVLTPPCSCGTERVLLACELMGIEDGLVLNVQGDMPGIKPEHINAVVEELGRGRAGFVTAAAPFTNRENVESKDTVKVVTDNRGRALYFSRAPIPVGGPWFRHLGIYGFTMDVLREYAGHEAGILARSEDLEQLRWLEIGNPIQVVILGEAFSSIDTPEQLASLRSHLKSGKLKYPVLSE
jgi:3-deoxy-manno-octulosonate cytidylyltransferase (CMP-KDO synthetase)